MIFGSKKGGKSRNCLIYTLCCEERGIDFVHPLRCCGHPCKKKKQTNLQINLSFCLLFFLRREGFLLWQATSSITNPHSGVLIPSNAKKGSLSFLFLAEREALEPTLSRNIIKLQITDNHILSKVQSKSKSF